MYNYVIMTERKEIKDEKRPSSCITQNLLIGLSNKNFQNNPIFISRIGYFVDYALHTSQRN